MTKYVCKICSYVYDPEKGDPSAGIESGIKFEDLTDDWTWPEYSAINERFGVYTEFLTDSWNL